MLRVAEVDALIEGTQRLCDLTRDGSRARHETEMVLISLRNLRREIELIEDARQGQLAAVAVARPALRLVAPIDDPAFDV